MIKKLLVLAVLGISNLATADDEASVVITPGSGRLEIVSEYIIFSSGKSYNVKIPTRIEEGTRINISYKKDGEWIHDKFDVVRISTKGKLCRLHNKTRSQYDSSPGDTIYIKPCRYK